LFNRLKRNSGCRLFGKMSEQIQDRAGIYGGGNVKGLAAKTLGLDLEQLFHARPMYGEPWMILVYIFVMRWVIV
jgi:hypothetical protein